MKKVWVGLMVFVVAISIKVKAATHIIEAPAEWGKVISASQWVDWDTVRGGFGQGQPNKTEMAALLTPNVMMLVTFEDGTIALVDWVGRIKEVWRLKNSPRASDMFFDENQTSAEIGLDQDGSI